MSQPQQFESLCAARFDSEKPIHLAIGMFDGVHLGHRKVIERAVAAARQSGGVSGVLTFWPHPSRLFRPDDPSRMILCPETKRLELGRQGVDFIIEEAFTHGFAAIEAERFMEVLTTAMPRLATVHAGENWRFGKGRRGDMALLERLGAAAGVAVDAVDFVRDAAERISSTRIRNLLLAGEIEAANALLGYEYYSLGTVTQGKRMGRTIGAPTLNLPFEGDLKPAYGVYVVSVSDVSLNHRYKAVANFGLRPTVETTLKPLLEAHLLEPCPFDYGHRLKVVWHRFLRQERRFESVDALKVQIDADIVVGKQYFGMIPS